MKYEKTYRFLEEFLKWNFDPLNPTVSEMLYGSPSVAIHMSLNLRMLGIENHISIVLFEEPSNPNIIHSHRAKTEDFLVGTGSIRFVPAHFVTSIHDSKHHEVHFDSKGDITSANKRISSIYSTDGKEMKGLVALDKVPKTLHGLMVDHLRTAMGRMHKMYGGWSHGARNRHWDQFDPYWRLIGNYEGKRLPRKKSKSIIKK